MICATIVFLCAEIVCPLQIVFTQNNKRDMLNWQPSSGLDHQLVIVLDYSAKSHTSTKS